MLDKLSLVIIKEIIKRIIEYESIDNLIKLNKRFTNFIINDRICKERYLFIKYNLIVEKDHLKLIRLLNSKSYSKYVRKGSSTNDNFATFVRPKDDKFIIARDHNFAIKNFKKIFKFSERSMIPTILKILDEKIEDVEYVLTLNDFFYLNVDIKELYFREMHSHINSPLESAYFAIDPQTGNMKFDVLLHNSDFDPKILEIINEL